MRALDAIEDTAATADRGVEEQVKALAISRVGVGALLVVAPGPVLRVWLGKGANDRFSRVLARSVGGRDIALGLGATFALRHGSPLRGWLEAIVVADATDLLALAAVSRHLSRGRVLAAAIPSVSAVVLAKRLIAEIKRSQVGTATSS